MFYNRTRRSRSIPVTLLRRGHLPAIPLYWVLRLSELAREGFENSGSYRFADHIYRDTPAGRGPIGRWIDARLLSMPAVRSFRNRYLAARDALVSFLVNRPSDRDVHVLSVPSGIMGAIFLAELGPDSKLAQTARFAAKTLTGLPSILAL